MRTMSNALLEIEPRELKFVFELKKQATCSVHLINNSNSYVAFKVKTTSPKKYSVRPNTGIIEPKSSCNFTVTMQAQRIAPPDMICKDKFLLQATVVPAGTEDEDIKPFLFSKEDGRYVEENKLRVLLISPPNSPVLSPVNGTFKPVPVYEVSVLEDPVQRKFESVFPYPKGTETVEAEMKLSAYAKPENDLVYSPVKVVEEPTKLLELKEPEKKVEFNTAEEIEEPAKSVEYNATKKVEEPAKSVAYNQIRDVKEPENDIEYNIKEEEPVKDVEYKTMKAVEEPVGVVLNASRDLEEPKLVKDIEELKLVKDIEELKLVKDIEEMKSKVNELEAKLSKAEVTISKLTEERRWTAQETHSLQKEVVLLRSNKGVAKAQVGFPCLFVCMVALVCTFLGYLLGC